MTAERVAQAAVKVTGRIFTGPSHRVAVLVAANALGLDPAAIWRRMTPGTQGFVTTRGRWLSRVEAWALAKRRGQLRWSHVRPGHASELQSEDLR